jgi:hypothetical protein
MTPLHALDHIRQSVNGSTDRTTRAGTGQFLTPAAIAQFMVSLFEDVIRIEFAFIVSKIRPMEVENG